MSNGHNMRVFWRVVKWSVSLLLCLVCGIIIWRMCSSGDPEKVKYYLDDDDLLHVPKLSVESITSWK